MQYSLQNLSLKLEIYLNYVFSPPGGHLYLKLDIIRVKKIT